MDWTNITLSKWNQIDSIFKKQYEDEILQTADIISVLFGIDEPLDLSPQEFQKYVQELSFLKEQIPEKKLCNTYVINGTTYNFKGNIMEVNMGQLMDWRKYSTNKDINYAECLSVFMIPDGHKYNDGYDIDKTIEDLSSLPIGDVLKLFSFFVDAQTLFISTLTNFFNRQLKKTSLPKEKRDEITEMMKQLNQLTNGIFSLSHSVMPK